MSGKILITPRSLTAQGLENVPELEPLRKLGFELIPGPAGRLPQKSELLVLCTDVVGWLAGIEKIDDEILTAAKALKVISRNGAGTDAIDTEMASVLGISVMRAAGANARGVAELALTLILCALRQVTQANEILHAGRWERRMGKEMPEIRLGIVGYGAIGRTLATLAVSLGAQVSFYDPFAAESAVEHSRIDSLATLFASSDVVSLHSPPPENGKALVDDELLSLLPHGAILVNTARESLVNDSHVLAALEAGRLASYAVDAFDSEPPALTALLMHPNTVLTPHIGAYTGHSVSRAVQYAVNNLVGSLSTGA
ncbi:NAD(P)-dependent oxidoreductase [Arthrobacter psychrochitiniphilus]|nr:NAD(P)-dependent oxidoreductase [Arthrobacter psychrochitiniphilus]NYG16084.1 D-3-phosphoglycerate dehydrogenase [Arthrobacter psychrochitiniphilus]